MNRYNDGPSLLDATQFPLWSIEKDVFSMVFKMEEVIAKGGSDALGNKTIVILSSTPIVETRLSLETAMRNLGGEVVVDEDFEYIGEGQQLEDQVRALGRSGVDLIAMSHHIDGMVARAAAVSTVPVINISEGNPVRGLCDAFTMRKELDRRLEVTAISQTETSTPTHIAIVGALAKDKAAKTLTYLLGKLWFVVLYFISPEDAKMEPDIKAYLARHGVKFHEMCDLRDVIREKVNPVIPVADEKADVPISVVDKVDVIYQSGRDMIFNRNGHTPSDNTVAVNMAVLMMALSRNS